MGKKFILILMVTILISGCQSLLSGILPTPASNSNQPQTTMAPAVLEPGTEAPALTATPTQLPEPTPTAPSKEITIDQLPYLQEVAANTVEMPVSIVWSKDSQRVGVLESNGFSIFSAVDGALIKSIQLAEPYYLLDASVERELIAVTTDQLTVEFRSMDSGEVTASIQPEEPFLSGSFHPDGNGFILTSAYKITVEEWDLNTLQRFNQIEGFETAAPVYAAHYNEDGTSIIWHARGTVQVYDLLDTAFGAVLGHEDFVNSYALAPNGRLLAAASLSTMEGEFKPIVRIWDAFGGQILGDLPTGDSIASHVHFSPDGTLLIVSAGNQVIFWQVQNQQEIDRLNAKTGRIQDAVFSPDSRTLAIIDDSGSFQLLRVVD